MAQLEATLSFTGVNSNTWRRLSWGAISKPTPARSATLGNSRVVEGPAPLKELGSRAPELVEGPALKELGSRAVLGAVTAQFVSQSSAFFLSIHVTGQTKSGSQAHHEQKNIKDRYIARIGVTRGPTLEPGLGLGLWRRRVPGGRRSLPRKVHEGPVQCGLGSSRGRGPQRPNPWTKTLAIGTWNVTSLGGRSLELVREVERYRLEIVGLTSTHSLGSGTQLLERGWTLHYSGVAQGERRRAGVGLLIAPQLSRHVLGVHPVIPAGGRVIGRNGLPDLNSRVVFCYWTSVLVTVCP
ncbi:hypothetical protein L3Q82_014188 [Scortum barcoo]|uniref:Uncharacterized protein n=1 Tax=Scortum barcoo TaxID=214431 RepID=A0ACB8VVV4_9TELE|nr:hypothetical protein L3Q82_014188 [Scortum barcoo]